MFFAADQNPSACYALCGSILDGPKVGHFLSDRWPTHCPDIFHRFKTKKWLVLIRPLLAGFDSTAGTNPRHEKLLDDPQALLYCDHEFDRQFVISLS